MAMTQRISEDVKYPDTDSDKRSPTFCWSKQFAVKINIPSMEINDGCCRVEASPLSEAELLALNLTSFLDDPIHRAQRKQLLDGEKDASCQFCWDIETHTPYSRRLKENKKIDPSKGNEEVGVKKDHLRKMELVLSNTCTLNCMYCSPMLSSSIARDVREHGKYSFIPHASQLPEPVTLVRNSSHLEKAVIDNVMPELDNVQYLILTGGEPTLVKHFWDVLDKCLTLPSNGRLVNITTNGMLTDNTLTRFTDKINRLIENGWVVEVDISVDTAGTHAEYIRYGLDYARFLYVREYLLLNCPGIKTKVAIVTSCFTQARLDEHMDTMLSMTKDVSASMFHFSPLANPYNLSLERLPLAMREDLVDRVDLVLRRHLTEQESLAVAFGWQGIRATILRPTVQPTGYVKDLIDFMSERDRRLGSNAQVFDDFISELKRTTG